MKEKFLPFGNKGRSMFVPASSEAVGNGDVSVDEKSSPTPDKIWRDRGFLRIMPDTKLLTHAGVDALIGRLS